MAAAVQQAAVPVFCATADVVANAFVHQYYLILHQSPQLVHQFYQDVSKLGRPEANGVMSITTTMQAINEKILSLAYGQFMVEITTVDAQESYNGGVLVLVTGYFTTSDYVRRKFTQTFFLAPQDKGYFVLNDVLRYVEDVKVFSENQDLVNIKETPLTLPQGPPVQEHQILEQSVPVEESGHEEVYNPPENGNVSVVEDETPVPEVVNESPNNSPVVAELKSNTEEMPKKSYASIVKFIKETPSSSSNELSPVKPVEKSQEQQVAPSPGPASDAVVLTSNAVENGTSSESESYGYSIYIKNLPINARPPLLENEFKKFGPIKKGGIQVRSQRGFCFGFVEFEMESSMQSAIEASPIMIGGRQAIVEQKKSTNRGNSRGRFSSRGGGYRNEGVRGRVNNGDGSGYARTDSENKNEFGNRGSGGVGYTNRRGDGYQRTNKMGGNGSRMHRASDATVNANAGTAYQRVSVQA